MMLNRWWPSTHPGPDQIPDSSGPRCSRRQIILSTTLASTEEAETMPAIPHIAYSCRSHQLNSKPTHYQLQHPTHT